MQMLNYIIAKSCPFLDSLLMLDMRINSNLEDAKLYFFHIWFSDMFKRYINGKLAQNKSKILLPDVAVRARREKISRLNSAKAKVFAVLPVIRRMRVDLTL